VPQTSARYVISILSRDHVGIIADVTGRLYELGGNLAALSQTVVWDWFTMILCGDFPAEVSAGAIKEALEAGGDIHAIVEPFGGPLATGRSAGDPYVISVDGRDQPGLVWRLARCCAERAINIEDVWNEVRQDQFVIILKVTVPKSVDPRLLRYQLEEAVEGLGVTISLQHQDIFTATNSLEVHTRPGRPVGGGYA
jgi:glycine cleavage system transcriptional repressor